MNNNEIFIALGVFLTSLGVLLIKMSSENDGKGSFSLILHFFVVSSFMSSFFVLLILLLNGTLQRSHVIAVVTIVGAFVAVLTFIRSL